MAGVEHATVATATSSPPAATGILTSRIGRRFVALFTGCALLPLLAFAWLTLTQATEQMRTELRASLHNGAKTAGMGIAARLSQVAGDLALAAEWAQRWARAGDAGAGSLQQHVGDRCEAVWLVDADGVQSLSGDAPTPLAPWTDSELAHLRAGKPVVRMVGDPVQLVVSRVLDTAAPGATHVAARIRTAWFWDPDELRIPGSDVAAFDSGWRPLFHTFRRLPNTAPLVAGASVQAASGTVEWSADGQRHLARYWRAFLMPQYHCDLFVVQSRPLDEALAVSDAFQRTFVLTAVSTLLLVVFASLVQMRRTLGPIVSLRDATRRVARGEHGVRVSIRSRDEFGELGAVFNDMTAQLHENIRRREQTERELLASRDEALAAARAKAEFVTNVSHEFRTPMTEILGAAEILGQGFGIDDAAREEFAGIALRGAKRLAVLIDEVLEFGSTALWTMGPVDPAATLHEAIAAMPGPLRQRLRVDIGDRLGTVRGNAARLVEVWTRLLDNAAKFSPAGAPIEVSARVRGAELVVAIVDQGVGISRVDLGRIFEPFCQVGRDQLTDKAHGTGLGLTLVKRAVERHLGRVEVDSELGNGATFRVVLPLAAAGVVAAGAATAAAADVATAGSAVT